MTVTALSGDFGSKPPRVGARESGVCLYGDERMNDTTTASNNSGAGGTTSGDDEQSDRERRAAREAFEFSVPVAGKVRVKNTGHDDGEEHQYVVGVLDAEAEWCTCPDHEHREVRCKHMIAVEDRPAIMQAATATEDEIERARADGGTEIDTGASADANDEPEPGDTRINPETGIPEVWIGEPDCPTAARRGWVIDPDRAEPVDQTEQRDRAYDLGVEDAAFGGYGGEA